MECIVNSALASWAEYRANGQVSKEFSHHFALAAEIGARRDRAPQLIRTILVAR